MAVFCYIGAPLCGKSTLLRRHVYEHPHDPATRFLIVDRDCDGSWLGPVFTSADAWRRLAYIPQFSVFRGVPSWRVAELAIDLGDAVYVDEEAHNAVAERPWRPWNRLEGRGGHPLFAIVHEGRHLADLSGNPRAVSAMLATHRPQNLPTDLTGCCTGVYVGRLPGFAEAERCYQEGWIPEAEGPRAARRILAARQVGEFAFHRCA